MRDRRVPDDPAEILGIHVPLVAAQDHHLVIAEEKVQPAAGRLGFAFQSMDEPETFGHMVTAVEHVADHDQMSCPPAPPEMLIDHTGRLQEPDELIVVSVNVTHGEDLRHVGELGRLDRRSTRRYLVCDERVPAHALEREVARGPIPLHRQFTATEVEHDRVGVRLPVHVGTVVQLIHISGLGAGGYRYHKGGDHGGHSKRNALSESSFRPTKYHIDLLIHVQLSSLEPVVAPSPFCQNIHRRTKTVPQERFFSMQNIYFTS